MVFWDELKLICSRPLSTIDSGISFVLFFVITSLLGNNMAISSTAGALRRPLCLSVVAGLLTWIARLTSHILSLRCVSTYSFTPRKDLMYLLSAFIIITCSFENTVSYLFHWLFGILFLISTFAILLLRLPRKSKSENTLAVHRLLLPVAQLS